MTTIEDIEAALKADAKNWCEINYDDGPPRYVHRTWIRGMIAKGTLSEDEGRQVLAWAAKNHLAIRRRRR